MVEMWRRYNIVPSLKRSRLGFANHGDYVAGWRFKGRTHKWFSAPITGQFLGASSTIVLSVAYKKWKELRGGPSRLRRITQLVLEREA